MELGLTGRVALVTGASKGIGLETALAFAREGARVVLCARGAEALDAAAGQVRATGAEVLTLQADVSKRDDLERLVAQTVERFGTLEIVVNNAGEAPRGAAGLTDAGWLAHLEQYLMSVVRLTELSLPHMRARRWGRVIAISSVAGERPSAMSALAVSKAAVNNYVRGLARDVASDGVTVNAVAPGLVWTPHRLKAPGGVGERLAAASGDDVDTALEEYARRSIPIGRYVQPEEVAALTVFLCSEPAASITGTVIPIDGGAGGSLLPPEAPKKA